MLYLDYSVQNVNKMCTIRTIIALIPRTSIDQIRFTHDCEEKNLTLSADLTRTPPFVSSFIGSCTLLQQYSLSLSVPNPSIRILFHRLVHSFTTVFSISLCPNLKSCYIVVFFGSLWNKFIIIFGALFYVRISSLTF
jgi:hypothetical protein